jgi:DNA-binding response OmpR family regulator
MGIKLILIEDDLDTSVFTKEYLDTCGFDVDVYSTITDATINIKHSKNYDLALLDLNLPDFDGFELLKYLNKNNITLPVIAVSAYSQTQKKLEAFKLGVVDYMVKPVDMDELVARIWVHLSKSTKIQTEKTENIFKNINNTIYFNDKHLKLTSTEYKIFTILLENKNNLIGRDQLAKSLSSKSNQRTLDFHINNIRKKIDSDKEYIHTEYGMGYRLITPI